MSVVETQRIHQGPAAGMVLQVALLALLAEVAGLGVAGWLAGTVYGLGVCLALSLALVRHRAPGLGPADHVTLVRAMLTGCVAALVVDGDAATGSVAALVAFASVALVLDAVDGQVARRTGTVSPLGARFDMEVDAFLILVLSIFAAGSLGPWVLTIGAMRYVFLAASRPLPWLNAALPHSLARKTIAALQGILLVVVVSGVLPWLLAQAVAGLALATLSWSFGRDIRWLHRNRPAAAADRPTRVRHFRAAESLIAGSVATLRPRTAGRSSVQNG